MIAEVLVKTTGICPKCTSTEIRVMRRRIYGTIIPLNRTLFGAAYTSWFICTTCGFVEAWVEDRQDLEKIRTKLTPWRPA